MLNIQATKQQLIAMSNRMMLKGDILIVGEMQGHRWLELNYEGRDIEILFNRVFGVYRISAITDYTLKQDWTLKQDFFEVSE